MSQSGEVRVGGDGRVAIGAVAVATVAVIVGGIIFMLWSDPGSVRARNELLPDTIRVQRGLLYVGGLALSIFLIGEAAGRARCRWKDARRVYAREGMLPAIERKDGTLDASHIEDGTQPMAALTGGLGHVDRAPNGVRDAWKPPELMAPDPKISVELLPTDVTRPDFEHCPQTLIVGKSGQAGKTNTAMAFLDAYNRALPTAEIMVLSLVGHNWQGQVNAESPQHILDAMRSVKEEMTRRGQLLKDLRVSNAWTLREDQLHTFVLIVDEAEEMARSIPGAEGQELRRLMGSFASTGRNYRMAGLWLTQIADRAFFPKAVIENSNVLLGNMGPNVAAAFGVWFSTTDSSRLISDLASAPPGRYYALHRSAWVQFPLMPRVPRVRLSNIYREPLQLAADGEADGRGDTDQPDGINLEYAADGTRYTVQTPRGAGYGRYSGIVYRVPDQDQPDGWLTLTDADEGLHRRIWDECRAGAQAIKTIQAKTMQYQGGTGFYLVREIRSLGRDGKLPWMQEA